MTQPKTERRDPAPTAATVAAAFSAFAKSREGMSFARAIAEARTTTTEKA